MRGDDQQQSGMFSYVSVEERVPQDHPLRAIRKLVDQILGRMASDFDGLCAKTGRPSIPAGTPVASGVAADLLFGPQRADADGIV